MKKQLQIGAIVAYINIFINMFISVFLTPFIIGKLGSSEYGVYKIVSSFSANLGIVSFGMSSLIARNIVYFNTKKQKIEKENFLFMAELESIGLFLIVLIFGCVLYFSITPLYSDTLTVFELQLAKKLFLFLVLNVAFNILCDAFSGMIKAHEKFVIFNLINTFRYFFRLITLVVLLNAGVKSIGVVLADLGITVIILFFTIFYSKIILKERARYYYFDKEVFKSGLAFSLAVFLQAIVNQFNNNLDNVVLGAMIGANIVTIYSVALTIYAVFNSFVTVIGGMYGPRTTRLVAEGADGEKLTLFVMKPARIQASVALLGVVGFALVGRDFIHLWLGDTFSDVYYITLILIVPVVLPLIESVTNAILDAMLKRLARSLILVIMCFVNLGVSVFLIHKIGYIGAAFGTAFSLIVGHGIIMNIYLHKKIGLNIPMMLKGIFKGILLCSIITLIVGQVVAFLPVGWCWLAIKTVIISFIYVSLLYFFGFNNLEKDFVKSNIVKIFNKLRRN